MPTHISLRLAWHDNGWNGCLCKKPETNTYCVGAHSYPGQKICNERHLDLEKSNPGEPAVNLPSLPPCKFSFNAFGSTELTVSDIPPDFFKSGKEITWTLPPYTACTWPYEEMYRPESKTDGHTDGKKRRDLMQTFFSKVQPKKSLVFYYANYSNPLSPEEHHRYLLVGVARISKVGDVVYYPDVNQYATERYGGFAWQRNITSDYPNQGFRIPYHLYQDQPEILERIAVFPDNDRCFKYATRHMTDDDALSVVERMIEVGRYLRDELEDKSEDWTIRLQWLESLFVELWKGRGLYPGFASVMEILRLSSGVTFFRKAVEKGEEKAFKERVMAWIRKEVDTLPNWSIAADEAKIIRREWQLLKPDEQQMLGDVLPRFDLSTVQMRQVLEQQRVDFGIDSALADIADNPFILSEEYQGSSPDDRISYSRIEHGIYPSPELGGNFFFEPNAWQRLRALCVTRLKSEPQHTFMSRAQLLQEINRKISWQPDWKRFAFTDRYFDVDKDDLQAALEFRRVGERDYIYLRTIYDAERALETQIRTLAGLPDIDFKSPVTLATWKDFLTKADSDLALADRAEYDKAITSQAEVCDKIFRCHVSVICGSAGTGKTTVVESIIKAIEKAHGKGTPFCLLAPTGKAADRLRDRTGKDARTIHSFLAQLGWLRKNMTFRQTGGRRESGITTYIIDECSMLDLELTAALFRAVNWNAVQRLIFVGDPNQLPPIGKGRVFADIIDWLAIHHPGSVGELTVNLRQMENRIKGLGTGILDLASVFIKFGRDTEEQEESRLKAENFFKRLQNLPEDGSFDKDLRVLYWTDTEELHKRLEQQLISDMEADSGQTCDPEQLWSLRDKAWRGADGATRPEYQQIISPYRGEDFGTQALNLLFQQTFLSDMVERAGALAGIHLFDKVIQYRNRGLSEPIAAYNHATGKTEPVTVFNGEIGMVMPHGRDCGVWMQNGFRIKRFSIRFMRKESYAVGFGQDLGYKQDEPPEDNLELAYAISVHKAQGSEFERVYFVLPKHKARLLSPELVYTGLTRAKRHCTIFVEEDVSPLLRMYRPENSHLLGINTSLFDFRVVPDDLANIRREGFLEEYRIHSTLADIMVRSKSEVIIANLLFERDIPFYYEKPLYARDGSFYLPDFTITYRGEDYYWEHLGMLEQNAYREHWELKKAWYDEHFPGKLLITEESGNLSKDAEALVLNRFA